MRRITRSPETVAAAREQHRRDSGQFGTQPLDEATLGSGGVDLAPAMPLDDAIATVRDEFTWIDLTAELFNHSVDSDADMLTLADMADPDLARNNCDAASQALLVEWGGDAQPVALHFESTDAPGDGDRVQHAAIETVQDGHRIIIDITARQFDPDAPFPLVMERSAWKEWVTERHHAIGYSPEPPASPHSDTTGEARLTTNQIGATSMTLFVDGAPLSNVSFEHDASQDQVLVRMISTAPGHGGRGHASAAMAALIDAYPDATFDTDDFASPWARRLWETQMATALERGHFPIDATADDNRCDRCRAHLYDDDEGLDVCGRCSDTMDAHADGEHEGAPPSNCWDCHD